MTYRTERNLTGGIVLVILAIVAIVFVSFKQSERVRDSSRWVTHTQEVLLRSEKIMLLVTDYETSSRGFALTGQPSFILNGDRMKADLRAELDSLTNLTVDNAAQQQRIDSLEYYINERLMLSDSLASVRANQGMEAVTKFVATWKGKDYMDSVKMVISELQNNEKELLRDRRSNNARAIRNFAIISLIFLLLVSIALILLIYNARQNLKRLRRSESAMRYNTILMKNMSDAVISTDQDFKVKTWNRHAEQMLGWNEEDVVGKSTIDIIKSPAFDKSREERRKLLMEKGFTRDEIVLIRKNGEAFHVLVSTSLIRDDKSDVIGTLSVMRDISDSKKMEQQLLDFNRNLEQQVQLKTEELTNAFERISDGFFAVDTNWNYKYVNSKAGELMRRDSKQIIGKNHWEVIPESIGSPFHEAYYRAMREQVTIRMEAYYPPYDKWYENVIYPSQDGLSVYFQDITERVHTQEQLSREHNLMRTLIDNLPDYIYVKDKDFKYVINNKAIVNLVEAKSEEETLGKTVIDLFGEEVAIENFKEDKQLFETGTPVLNRDEPIKTPAGEERWLLTSKVPLKDRTGNITGLVGISRDITDRKRAEEAVKESEQKYKLLFTKNPLPMWMFSIPDRDFIEVNEAAIAHYGYSREEFLTMNAKDIRPAKEVDNFVEGIKGRPPGTYYAGVWVHKKKDGSLINVEIITHDITYENKPVRLVLANDVTEKIKAQSDLQESHDQLRQLAMHMEEVREEERIHIAREIHDELGQQLTGIKMDVSWISRKLVNVEEATQQKIKMVLGLIDGAIKTVRKISSELRPSLLDDLGLGAAMEWHGEEFARRSGLKIVLDTPISHQELPSAMATGLFRIYQESLTNVARHANATDVIATLQFTESRVVVTVTDNGQGFDPSKIGEKKTLGLLGIKERALMMNGRYEIKSNPGEGTTVEISVPL